MVTWYGLHHTKLTYSPYAKMNFNMNKATICHSHESLPLPIGYNLLKGGILIGLQKLLGMNCWEGG